MLLRRRESGLPLEQVLGWAEFHGLRMLVEPEVFVPRRRSEVLVDEALRLASPSALILDLCCGSGALATALAHRLSGAEVWASDLHPAAVRCARRNLAPYAAHVVEGDLYDPLPRRLRGTVDLLVVNAPYVPTDAVAMMPPEARDHEPRMTLDGGPDGLDLQRRVIVEAGAWLAPNAHLLIETSQGQAPVTAAAMAAAGFSVRVVRDEERDGTVVVGSLAAGCS